MTILPKQTMVRRTQLFSPDTQLTREGGSRSRHLPPFSIFSSRVLSAGITGHLHFRELEDHFIAPTKKNSA